MIKSLTQVLQMGSETSQQLKRVFKHGIVYDIILSTDQVILDSSFEDWHEYTRDLIYKIINETHDEYKLPVIWRTCNQRLADNKLIFYHNSVVTTRWKNRYCLKMIDEHDLVYDYLYDFTYLGGKLADRPDKIQMLSRLHREKLLDNTLWSGGSYTPTKNDPQMPDLPKILDWDKDIKGVHSHECGTCSIPLNFYLNSRFSVVQETEMTARSNRYTEKTVKCFFVKQPFILAGNWQTLQLLQHDGFKTFHPYIDESYDQVKSISKRIDMIIEQIKKLKQMNSREWNSFINSISNILDHNYNHILNIRRKIRK